MKFMAASTSRLDTRVELNSYLIGKTRELLRILSFCLYSDRMSSVLRGMKVLVVDDEKDITDIFVEDLEAVGCEVTVAPNGTEGLREYRRLAPDFILSDVRMFGGDGLSMLREIRAEKRSTPPYVIMMSGFFDVTEKDVIGMGAQAFVSKPFDYEAVRGLMASLKSPAKS